MTVGSHSGPLFLFLTVAHTRLFLYRITFGFLAAYFLVMGAFLMLFPDLLLRNLGGVSNQTIIGMCRGTGGATIPYALLYILIAIKPKERQWASSVILFANSILRNKNRRRK
jgi:hypothetical protein